MERRRLLSVSPTGQTFAAAAGPGGERHRRFRLLDSRRRAVDHPGGAAKRHRHINIPVAPPGVPKTAAGHDDRQVDVLREQSEVERRRCARLHVRDAPFAGSVQTDPPPVISSLRRRVRIQSLRIFRGSVQRTPTNRDLVAAVVGELIAARSRRRHMLAARWPNA